MTSYSEIVASKGAFRKTTKRVVSQAPSTLRWHKPKTFPELRPGDVVHVAVCGPVVKNPVGGDIYCENNFPCLESITCPHKGQQGVAFRACLLHDLYNNMVV